MALTKITFSLPNKGLFLLTGDSGSGKSSLLNILGGMDLATGGEFCFDGETIDGKSVDEYRSKNVSFVFQSFNLIEEYTVGLNLEIAFSICGFESSKELIEKCLKNVNLPDGEPIETFLKKRINELSGGQMQRLAIARSLIKRPKVLLLDEPLSSLDKANGAAIIPILREIAKEALVLVSTHDKTLFEDRYDGEIRLDSGRLVDCTFKGEEVTSFARAPFVKPRISFLQRLRFAFGVFGKKKGRLAVSLLSLALSFCAGAFALTLANADLDTAVLSSQLESGLRFAFLSTQNADGESFFGDDQLARLESETYCPYKPFRLSKPENSASKKLNLLDSYMGEINMVSIKSGMAEKELSLTPSSSYGSADLMHLPRKDDEIAITDLLAEYLFRNQKSLALSFSKPIDEKSEVLMSRLYHYDEASKYQGSWTITGVYQTEEKNRDLWLDYDFDANSALADGGLKADVLNGFASGNSLLKSAFVLEEESDGVRGIVLKTPNDLREYRRLLSDLSFDGKYEISVFNAYSGCAFVLEKNSLFFGYFAFFLGAVSLVLISGLLLSYYFSIIKDAEKPFGVLKAIGATSKTIFSLIVMQILFLFAATLGVGLLGSSIISAAINGFFMIDFLTLGPLGSLLFLSIGFLFIVGVSLFSWRRIKKQTPITIING
ncbi:MAG: ATP-binding cassette domain-containing protein [Bacilli bacterium]|nr:ATP-binding cassette domain-containing protein [Bacilli bacterium]